MSTKPSNTPRSPSYAAVASKGTAEEKGARVKQQTKSLSPVKLYLVVYNLVSALLWANLLFLTIHSVITHPVPSVTPSSNVISRYLFSQSALVPGPISNFLAKLQGSYHHGDLGWWTKWTQSLAVLEVVHASLGWVRSPLGTTAAQVYSRLWTVWGVVESNKETHSSAFFTTMLFAWSFTEVIRYSYYVCTLLGISTKKLDKLRYTTFIPLYPLGASSEAALAFYTLPPLKNLPFLPEWIKSASPVSHLVSILPLGAGKKLATTSWGRSLLWKAAKSSLKSKTQLTTKSWGPYELWTLAMFVLWFPALYVMYMYMFAQRRKVLGKGRVLGEKKRA